MKYTPFLLLSFLLPAFTSAQVYLGSNGLTVSGSGSTTEIKLGGTLTQHTDIDLNSVYNLNFKNGSSNALSILSNGNIGIGTATPAYTLHVNGTTYSQFFTNSAVPLGAYYDAAVRLRWGGSGGTYIDFYNNDGNTTRRGAIGSGADSRPMYFIDGIGTFLDAPIVNIGSEWGKNDGARFAINNPDGSSVNAMSVGHTSGNSDFYDLAIKPSGNVLIGTNTDAGQKLQVFGNASFYNSSATAGAGGVVIKQNSVNTGGFGLMEIAGTSSAWTSNMGFTFMNHIPEVRIGATLYGSSNIGAKSGWFGTDEIASASNTLLLTADATNAYITSMKYASSPYPDTYISAPDIYFNTKTSAGWPDGNAGAYGITRLAITQAGNIGIGTTAPTANLQITSPSIANRDAGPYQFAINDGTINRLYAVHDVAATVMALVSPSGNVQSAIQGDESGMHIYASRGINVAASQGYAVSLLGSYNLFIIDGNEKARMSAAGFGIGTTSPSAQLHTTGTVRFAGLGNDNTQSRVIVSDADGNLSYRDAATVGSPGWAFNGSAVGALKSIGTVDNYDLPIITNNTEQMRITAAGNVLIGTTIQQGKLAVNGDIYAKKVKVTQNGWADYVFNKNYPLPTLAEVELYIQQHKHLQDVPSAATVEKDGVDLGDNQATLLKKVEELTLYIIEQNKRIEHLEKDLLELKKKRQ